MPEYLAPGVYVEEIDTGSKPIEGVSTSTAGMLGVTERGPVDVPILITSLGEYTRWFGERLNRLEFADHCYLPHAMEGFFTNGGKRVYVTRVLGNGAASATFDLYDRGSRDPGPAKASASTMLLRSASEVTGLDTAPLYVLNSNAVMPNTGTLADNDRIRIGGGSEAEYRLVKTVGTADKASHVPLNFPLSRGHDSDVSVDNINRVLGATPNTFSLTEAAAAGTTNIMVSVAAAAAAATAAATATDPIVVNDLLEIGADDPFLSAEHRFVIALSVQGNKLSLTLDSPLVLGYPLNTTVNKLNPAPAGGAKNNLGSTASSGDRVVYLKPPFKPVKRDQLVIFDHANDGQEARRIGNLNLLTLTTGAYSAYPAASVVQGVTLADVTDVDDPAKHYLAAPVNAGSTVISLDDRTRLKVNDIIRIGTDPDQEYATIAALPNPSPDNSPPNPGDVVLTQALRSARLKGVEVRGQNLLVRPHRPATVVVLDVASGNPWVPVTDGGQGADRYLTDDIIRVTTPTGDVSYHLLSKDADPLAACPVILQAPPLFRAHAAGSPVAERAQLLAVYALDPGAWGNRLRVSVEDEDPGLAARTTLSAVIATTRIRLASAAGVEAGTVLELLDAQSDPVGEPVKVAAINRATGDITLQGTGLAPSQQVVGLGVRSREFRLTVYLLRQPDPAMPSRNQVVLDFEVFRYLSLDPRHSHYVQRIIGTTWTAGAADDDDGRPLRLSDHRSEGESRYIRVRDFAQSLTDLESVRLGPETLVDRLPDGRQRPARHALNGGDDSIATLTDDAYIGEDDPNPEERTGLNSLRNIEDISIVACPGRTTPTIQNALINHCELMRYRFAVLDGPSPPSDSLADVQNQRQQFDTKYAALYHPWLLIPDPYPSSTTTIPMYPIPPSGHMLGVYARIDIERGVHKAPANEVVRGIIGLQRLLNKEQHDILNPYPVNINVIRDFRNNNRGIRVYGGRVITSDSDWKYVNVRRLLIFIEASIDRGLQWVVFEPNAEPLWARVRRSISNFLTLVWRNGALEGAKVEEAYFVKCDRTTMTQTDIDSGRLIVMVGVAPVKPAEFVIVRIGLWTAHTED